MANRSYLHKWHDIPTFILVSEMYAIIFLFVSSISELGAFVQHYVVLSRKYRPKVLDDLIGQEVLARSLRSCLDTKKVPHAFLFHGIRGVGKTTTARILARCLCCTGSDGKTDITSSPCGVCRSCTAMDKDQHMDVMEFDAASRTGVDDIREVIDASQYMPVLGRYKIFIIDEVHMLSKSAFNALLKTLEEPPAHVKFIFATTEIHKIPETILSRCMTFQLNPVSATALSKYLVDVAKREGFTLEQAAANTISEEAEGSVRDALSILEQATMLADNARIISTNTIVELLGGASSEDIGSLLELILDAKTSEALAKSEGLMAKGADPFVIFKNLQGALYRCIVDNVGGKLKKYGLSNLLYLWQIFLKQTENMKNATHPKYVLNAAIIILAYTASFPDMEKLMIKASSEVETAAQPENAIAQDNSKRLINDVLSKFPGSVAREVE